MCVSPSGSSPLPVQLTCDTCVCLPFSVFFPLCSRSSCVPNCHGQQALVTIFLASLLICRQLNRAQHRNQSYTSPRCYQDLSWGRPPATVAISRYRYQVIKSHGILRRVGWLFAPLLQCELYVLGLNKLFVLGHHLGCWSACDTAVGVEGRALWLNLLPLCKPIRWPLDSSNSSRDLLWARSECVAVFSPG